MNERKDCRHERVRVFPESFVGYTECMDCPGRWRYAEADTWAMAAKERVNAVFPPRDRTEHARLWAVATLRDVANRIEAAPTAQAIEAAVYMSPALGEVERVAGLFLRPTDHDPSAR